jgi:polar amino acid transport system substrate-binding protein
LKKFCVLSIAVVVLALIVLPVATGCGGSTPTTAPSAYDITKLVAGLKVDSAAAALVPDKYKTSSVKVGCDSPYPPWEMFVGETDQFTGLDYDLAQAIGAKLGIKFEFVKASFDGIIIGIQAGNYNAAMSSMYDNKLRQETLDFVDYAKDGTGMLVKKGNPEKIKTFADLAGKNVGCEKGTTQAGALATLNEKFKADGKAQMTVSEFPDQPAALLAVQSGKVVCDLTDSSTGGYVALTTDNGATFEIVMDPKPPVGWETQPDGIGVLKSDTGLRDAIQKALQSLMDDGTYKTIFDHYGIQKINKATINAGTQPGT